MGAVPSKIIEHRILRLHNQGFTKTTISRVCGVCINVVRKTLKRGRPRTEKERALAEKHNPNSCSPTQNEIFIESSKLKVGFFFENIPSETVEPPRLSEEELWFISPHLKIIFTPVLEENEKTVE